MTSFDPSRYVGARVRGLQEYAPEPLEEIAARLELPVGQLIKLDANESPYGPTRRTSAMLSGYTHYHRYPDPTSRRLRASLGRCLGIDPAQIIVGNGSDELIDLILRLFRPGPNGGGIEQLITCPPTFGMYEFYGATNDLKVIECPRTTDFRVDVAAIEGLYWRDPQPKILFLASPNNPDGQGLTDQQLLRLLDLPILVVLDEAYVEFSGGSRVGWVFHTPNLIVLRTFSKWAGLAGLRIGYGAFPDGLMEGLWRLKSPYNVNGLAQAAALATLEDLAEAQANVDKIVSDREQLIERLRTISYLRVYDSQANYVLCRVEGVPIERLRRAMEQRGIILRYYDQPQLENHVRISVGTPMQNESVLITLRALEPLGGDHGP